jgi:fucose permease
MKIMGKSFAAYVVFQSLVFGGFILSSISIQFAAGRFSFYKLITRGTIVAVIGLTISFAGHQSYILFILGMFIASFGIGLFNGSIFRIAITSTGQSNSMSAATLNIIQASMLALGLEVLNKLCSLFSYSIFGFTLLNFVCGVVMLLLCLNFANMVKSRKWQ